MKLKNSLTPIRLTVEEMQARLQPADRTFLDQAVQIVVSEIDALERRVRAFSDFSSEPPVLRRSLDVNALVTSASRCSGRRIPRRHTMSGSTAASPRVRGAPISRAAS